MKIEFESGEQGYTEARELRDMVRFVVANTVAGSHDRQVLDTLEAAAIEHMQRPEYEALRAADAPAVPDTPLTQRALTALRTMLGPSRREMDLAHQRADALARAARAEHAAFEAVAETSRVARERDELAARLKQEESTAKG